MKNFKYILLAGVLAFTGMLSVRAEDIEINNVVNKFNELNLVVYSDDCNNNQVKANYETSNNTIKFTCNDAGEELFNWKYENSKLTFEKSEGQGKSLDDGALAHALDYFMDAILITSGNENISLPLGTKEAESDADFSVEWEAYASDPLDGEDFTPFVRQGRVFSELPIIKKISISTDKDKIKTIVEKYGDKHIRKILEKKPEITLANSTYNSVTITPKIDYDPQDETYKASCYLLRNSADSEGDYQLVATFDNCLTGNLVDNTVNPATEYYYRLRFVGSDESKQSADLTVTTAAAPVIPDPEPTPDDDPNVTPDVTPDNTVTPDGGKENPNTGAFVPSVILSLFAIGGVATLVYTNNKNRFKNY